MYYRFRRVPHFTAVRLNTHTSDPTKWFPASSPTGADNPETNQGSHFRSDRIKG
jgi:hypothetical protein